MSISRIGTNQILKNYQTGLNKSWLQSQTDMIAVMSGKKFQNISEDPATAARAFQLRKQYVANDDYINNVEEVASHIDTAASSALQVNQILEQVESDMLKALNDPTGEGGRDAIASAIEQLQEAVVASANAKFGDKFLFGGENVSFAPFELRDDATGVRDDDGNFITQKSLYFTNDGVNYYSVSDPDPLVQSALKEFADAEVFIDMGFGLEYSGTDSIPNSDNLVSNSVIDMSTSGLDMLGFGVSDDGTPTNIVDLMGQFVTELKNGLRSETGDTDTLTSTFGHFQDAKNDLLNYTTTLGTRGTFLNTTLTRLEENKFTLNEKIVATVNVDTAEAITNYSWSQFAYNQALKIGNTILTQSFIDYMR
ncbi:MAG: hypothetical protein R3Y53_00415 [Bacillota bacterium]